MNPFPMVLALLRRNRLASLLFVVLIAVSEDVFEGDRVVTSRADLVARLGGSEWSEVGATHVLPRILLEDYPGTWAGSAGHETATVDVEHGTGDVGRLGSGEE